MSPIEECLEIFLIPFEGVHKRGPDGLYYPYRCPAGFPTIGIGTLLKDMNHEAISLEKARELALGELESLDRRLCRDIPALLRFPRLRVVLMDFCYNMGFGAFKSSTLRKVVLRDPEDIEGIQRELMKWIHGGGKVLKGLKRRREAECNYLKKGN